MRRRTYSTDEIAAIRARYPIEGPKQLAIDLGRTPKGIQRKAQNMGLSCKRRDYRVEYSRAELKMIRKRYPNEGANQLVIDLGRTKAGIEQMAFRMGVKFRAYKHNEARWRDHCATVARESACENNTWMDAEHEQWMETWRNRRRNRPYAIRANE